MPDPYERPLATNGLSMTDSPPAISTSTGLGGSSERLEWGFLQCFGERTPGEEIQEGKF